MGPDSGGSRGICATCYRSPRLAACERFQATSLRFAEHGPLVVDHFRCGCHRHSDAPPSTVESVSAGSRGSCATYSTPSGVLACYVVGATSLRFAEPDPWAYKLLVSPSRTGVTAHHLPSASVCVGNRRPCVTCSQPSGLAVCEVGVLHLLDSRSHPLSGSGTKSWRRSIPRCAAASNADSVGAANRGTYATCSPPSGLVVMRSGSTTSLRFAKPRPWADKRLVVPTDDIPARHAPPSNRYVWGTAARAQRVLRHQG